MDDGICPSSHDKRTEFDRSVFARRTKETYAVTQSRSEKRYGFARTVFGGFTDITHVIIVLITLQAWFNRVEVENNCYNSKSRTADNNSGLAES